MTYNDYQAMIRTATNGITSLYSLTFNGNVPGVSDKYNDLTPAQVIEKIKEIANLIRIDQPTFYTDEEEALEHAYEMSSCERMTQLV